MSRSPSSEADDDGDWRSGVDEVGPEGLIEDQPPEQEPIEPGSPNAENVLFVVLGVLLTVGLLLSAVFPNAL
ncbi:hypothetical protein KU306_08575 [Haloferax larsenii]|uniref:DUF7312 domain-containing protein n=1 Tax=Haloferax larsenii TaxID=302484 RepID=A0ABY5RD52_HALLR|nr:hypothetical protein [Haloferax larsenii]UVE48993.1 hypothetical protein KU306_08575 [Haloferax larsenii]